MKYRIITGWILMNVLCVSFATYAQSFISPVFTFDTKPPMVTVIYPNGGQTFPASQPITVQWSASDEQPGTNPVSIGISTVQNGPYQPVIQNLTNTGIQTVQPPLVSTQYARIQVNVKDLYGNVGHDESNNNFTLTGGGVFVNISVNNIQNAQGLSGVVIQAIAGSKQYTALPTTNAGQYSLSIPPGYGYTFKIAVADFQQLTIPDLSFSGGNSYNLTYQLTPESPYSDYRIVPVALAPNPSILEVPEGGIGYAWFVVEGLKNNFWFPVPDIELTAQDEQCHTIQCATNILSYNFLTSGYHMQNAGVFSIKIPADIIGNGNVGDQEVITVMTANGAPITSTNRKSIIAKVKQYKYSRSWDYRIYGKVGAGVTTGFASGTGFIGGGSGSAITVELTGTSSNPAWSSLEISRRKDNFTGLKFEIGPPNIIPFIDVGFKNEVKSSFPYQSDYSFDLNNLQGLESLLAFYLFYEPGILFAGKVFRQRIHGAGFLTWIAEILLANPSQYGLSIARIADESGLDICNTQVLNVDIGLDLPNSFKLSAGPSLGVNVHVGGSIRKTTSGIVDRRAYISGGYDLNISVGPKWIGSNDNKGSFLYPFRFTNQLIPTNIGVEFEGKYSQLNNSFKSFRLTAGLESSVPWLNVFNLGGDKQKYKAWLETDNEYVRNIFYDCSELPGKISNIGNTGIQIAAQNNTFEEATTSFLSKIYESQNDGKPALLKYGIDGEANTSFSLDLDEVIPLPILPPFVIAIGGGIEANWSTRYSISEGYWMKMLPYLQTEMPNLPDPDINLKDVMDVLWDHVVTGQTLVELQNAILRHVIHKFIAWRPWKATTEQVLLNNEGSFLQISAQSIPATLDSLTSRYWTWEMSSHGDRLMDPEKQVVLSKYVNSIKKLRQTASGAEIGIGGFYKFIPDGYDFGDSTLISIKYPDSLVATIDENKLAVFWEDTLGIWHYLPSTPHPDSNKVTAYISHFTTYTLAPIMPNGDYGFNARPDSIPANGISTITLTSDIMYNADSTLLPDNMLFTISASRGTIITPDADPMLTGIQVRTQSSTIQFQLKSDTTASPISALAISVSGYAKCSAEVKLYDNTSPATPVITSAIALNNSIILRWDTVADIDLAGYKIYFDKDSPAPPYNGASSVWGDPSPVNVGMANSYKLSGLGNDSTFYVVMKAYDISGNESNYSLPVSVFVTPPPSVLEITNDTIFSGSSNCYNATDSIIVAGNGAAFVIKNVGSANLIAAKNITILPGAKVISDGYLHGYIAGEEKFCNLLDGNVNPGKGSIFRETPVFTNKVSFFKIYPNPTNGKFMIAVNKNLGFSSATIRIYNLLGAQVLTGELTTFQPIVLSLQNSPNGIYIVQIIIENQVSTAKIIKL